jgi:hypothetical protein
VSKRSQLFKVVTSETEGIEVKRLSKTDLRMVCGEKHKTTIGDSKMKRRTVDICRDNFTVQKIDKVRRNRAEFSHPARNINVAKSRKNSHQFNVKIN